MAHRHQHQHHAREALNAGDIFSAIAAPFVAAAKGGDAQQGQEKTTLTSYYYVTLPPTFTGSVVAYSTQNSVQAAAPTTTAPQASASASDQQSSIDVAPSSSTDAPQSQDSGSSSYYPTSIGSPTASIASTLPLLTASTLVTVSSTSTSNHILSTSATSAPTSIAQDSTVSSSDISSGSKAGIAIGTILAIGALLSIIFFCVRQQRKKKAERLEDEKYMERNDIFAANRAPSTRSVRTMSTAPRLSLRPVTQFLPGFADPKRSSRGNALNLADTGSVAPMASRGLAPQSAWDRPMTSNDQNRANPFGNHAESVDPVNAAGPPVIQGTGPGGDILAGAVAAGAVVGLARGASKRGNGPKPLDFTRSIDKMGPPSPAGTEFSFSEAAGAPQQTNGAAAIAAAGGPQNSTVHRVQLDFTPSMDDELEIRAGQLIRLLHEYDDGWALCIRLDRSQQGVVPRTCLSTRPVKPRPQQNGPRGNPPPGMRVPQQQGRPMSPAMNGGRRSASPASLRPAMNGPQYNPQGYPAGRPVNGNGQQRSNSPSPAQMQSRRLTPPGSSERYTDGTTSPVGSPPRSTGPIGRKPVPGQAM